MNEKKIKTENILKINFLEKMSIFEAVNIFNEEDKKVALAVSKATNEISIVIEKVVEKLKNEGRLFYIGAGTSGRLGYLDASEILPTFGVKDLIIPIMAGGLEAVTNPIEGSEDSEINSIEQLKQYNFGSQDCIIGIAASGKTPFVISALKYANSISAYTAGICCNKENEFNIAKNVIVLDTGSEVIMGSTRLKAGTATKMVLNMISSIAMIKLGNTYHNMMINLKASNEKLKKRWLSILKTIINCDDEEANKLLLTSSENLKVAIIMHQKKCDYDTALDLSKKIDDLDKIL